MKKKASSNLSNKQSETKAQWAGFYTCRLTNDLKSQINSVMPTTIDLSELVAEFAKHGYKISLCYDEGNNTWHVTVTGAWKWCANAGYSLTCEHASLGKAVFITWFVCAEFHQWLEWPRDGQKGKDNDW